MPLSTFLGAPTVETHQHYDAAGALTGTTKVTRESPWDEDTRQAAYALYFDELEKCPQCGGPRSKCSDPDVDWFPQRHICWKTAATEVAERRWEDRTQDEKPDVAGYLPTDGVRVFVDEHDLTPDDDFI